MLHGCTRSIMYTILCLLKLIVVEVTHSVFRVSEISVILCQVELLLEWQLPLGLPLEEYCSVWRKDLPSGTKPSPGEQ